MRIIKKQVLEGNNGMSVTQIITLAVYIFFTISGLILIKLGGVQQLTISSGNILLKLDIKTLLGILCYLVSFIVYVLLISKFQLSYIMPLTTGLVYIFVLITSVIFLNEKIDISQWVGAGVILIGIIIMNLKSFAK